MIKIEFHEVEALVRQLAEKVKKSRKKYSNIYGIPKNGLIVAYLLSSKLGIPVVSRKDLNFNTTLVVDDLVDSGKTISKFSACDCLVLISKKNKKNLPKHVKYVGRFTPSTKWIDWYWENYQRDPEDNVVRILEHLGEDPNRDGLKETPDRVVRSHKELFGGYKLKPEDVLKTTFSSGYDEMILLRDIPLYSTCEHHMLPFIGVCHIAYIPGISGKVVGISKLARLMEVYARRLQIQEQLTMQIGSTLVKYLKPKGVAVIIKATHLCIASRGVEKSGSSMVTSFTWGNFRKSVATREEFLRLIKL